jgi:lipid-binding SYLF domain-containing protein
MSKRLSGILALAATCLIFASPSALWADEMLESETRIANATLVLQEFMKSFDRKTAEDLMQTCAAVAIFPSVYKGAFFVGGQYGKGVMCSRDQKTNSWSAPAFFTIGGGSFGLQFGGEAVDLLLFVMNEKGLESLLKGKGTLGFDVSVAAGPVGREARAETDIRFKAGIYAYSQSKGLFAGISLKGAVVSPDNNESSSYYGESLFAQEILLEHKVGPKGNGIKLINAIEQFAGQQKKQ